MDSNKSVINPSPGTVGPIEKGASSVMGPVSLGDDRASW